MLAPALASPIRLGSEPPHEDTLRLEPYAIGWQRSACAVIIVAPLVLDAPLGKAIPALIQFLMANVRS